MAETLAALAEELLRREMATDPEQFKVRTVQQGRPNGPMTPGTLHTIGAIADAAGTYAGMRAFGMPEDNALINRVAHGNPELTAGLAGVGSVFGGKALARLIGKFSPAAAEALSANLGSQQLGLGGAWLRLLTDGAPQRTGFRQYNDAIDRWHVERDRRR